MVMKKVELLAPAGNLEKLKIAVKYGADAVYFGGKAFGLRAFGGNFTDDEIALAVDFLHKNSCKAYVTVNIFPYNSDLKELAVYLHFLEQVKVDALIISDLGVYRLLKEEGIKIPFHVSTQANTVNWQAALFWQELGAERVVLGREVSLKNVKEIRKKTSLELENFIHGAMCISYSGRCLLSNYFNQRDANKGECTHPCRWKYFVSEETRPGELHPIAEDRYGSYIFNSKDLCMLPHLYAMLEAGVKSFKIEGRMKSVHYIATVVKVYREAIDACIKEKENFYVREKWQQELNKVSHRPYTTGFYFNQPGFEAQVYEKSSNIKTHDFIGIVRSYDKEHKIATIEQRNNLKIGECIEFLLPKGETFEQINSCMYDENDESITVAPHAQQIIKMYLENPVQEFTLLRRKCIEGEKHD